MKTAEVSATNTSDKVDFLERWIPLISSFFFIFFVLSQFLSEIWRQPCLPMEWIITLHVPAIGLLRYRALLEEKKLLQLDPSYANH